MVARLFLFGFCAGVLFFSVSDGQHRTIAAQENIHTYYDASYKL